MRAESFDLERIHSRLKQTRTHTLANMKSLAQRFSSRTTANGGATAFFADDAAGAVGYINRIVGLTGPCSFDTQAPMDGHPPAGGLFVCRPVMA